MAIYDILSQRENGNCLLTLIEAKNKGAAIREFKEKYPEEKFIAAKRYDKE